jgi:hypothetical protein
VLAFNDSLCAVLLFHEKNRTVVSAPERLNDAQFQPFANLILKIPVVGLRNLKLLHVDGFLRFHQQFMKEGVAVPNLVFVEAEDAPVSS